MIKTTARIMVMKMENIKIMKIKTDQEDKIGLTDRIDQGAKIGPIGKTAQTDKIDPGEENRISGGRTILDQESKIDRIGQIDRTKEILVDRIDHDLVTKTGQIDHEKNNRTLGGNNKTMEGNRTTRMMMVAIQMRMTVTNKKVITEMTMVMGMTSTRLIRMMMNFRRRLSRSNVRIGSIRKRSQEKGKSERER